MRFKKGTLAKDEYKSLKNSDTKINSCKELKNDQIRIIFKNIKVKFKLAIEDPLSMS